MSAPTSSALPNWRGCRPQVLSMLRYIGTDAEAGSSTARDRGITTASVAIDHLMHDVAESQDVLGTVVGPQHDAQPRFALLDDGEEHRRGIKAALQDLGRALHGPLLLAGADQLDRQPVALLVGVDALVEEADISVQLLLELAELGRGVDARRS